MRVERVKDAVVVVVLVEVILHAVTVEVARPGELVDAPVIVVVFVISAGSRPVAVLVGHTVVVVVKGVLVNEVILADLHVGPWVDGGGRHKAVRGHVLWVQPKGLKGGIIHRPFQNSVVIVVPVIGVEDPVVVVVVGVRAVAAVKALEQVIDAVVVVIEVRKVVDAVVVVVFQPGLLEEGGVAWQAKREGVHVADDAEGDTRVGPHDVRQRGVQVLHRELVKAAVPGGLSTLVHRLWFDQGHGWRLDDGGLGWCRLRGGQKNPQAAEEHQQHKADGGRVLLSIQNLLFEVVVQHAHTLERRWTFMPYFKTMGEVLRGGITVAVRYHRRAWGSERGSNAHGAHDAPSSPGFEDGKGATKQGSCSHR